MASEDKRRADLVVPYVEPPPNPEAIELSSTLASTMPMAAIFTRNKYIGWSSVIFAVQSWLGESAATRANTATPGYFSVGMSVMSLAVCYLPIFLPQQNAYKKVFTPEKMEA